MDIRAILNMTGNDKVFAAELLQMFIAQVSQDLVKLQEQCDTKDWAGVQFLAHRMRSSIGPFGMAETLDTLKSLEQKLKAGITSEAENSVLLVKEGCNNALQQAEILLKNGF